MDFCVDRDYIAIPSKTFNSGVAYSFAFRAEKAGKRGQAANVSGSKC
jgi:hypothetical protein